MNATLVHVLYGGLGGHGAVLLSLLESGFMRNARHRVMFIGVEAPGEELIDFCRRRNIPWMHQPRVPSSGYVRFVAELRQQLAALKPDVLFLHGLAAVPAAALLRLRWRRPRPFLLLRETQANHLKSRKEWIALAIAHAAADRVVHLTPEAAEGARQCLRILARPSKVCVIPNGLDTSFYAPAQVVERGARTRLRIGMLSRLQANKDHPTLLAAFAALRRRQPGLDVELHIAGAGATYDDIRQTAASLGIADRTVMRGVLTGTDVPEFLRSLDLYVHCTHGETMSTAIMQSLACGLPVIASDVEGVRNMVRPEAGILHEAGNPSSLAALMEELLMNPVENARWRRLGRDFAVRHFSIATTVAAYEAILPERFRSVPPDSSPLTMPEEGRARG